MAIGITKLDAIDPLVIRVWHANGQSMDIQCSKARFIDAMEMYRRGSLIQTAFHFLTVEEREFMMTGMNPMQQAVMFGNPHGN